MKETIGIIQSLEDIAPPPDDEIIVTGNGVVITSIQTLMRATENMVATANLRVALAKRESSPNRH